MKTQQQGWRAALLFLLLLCLSLSMVLGDPVGTTISNPITSTAANQSPSVRSDARGTITTMVINGIQQDQRWKAYVGNVSGQLTLQNANNNTIYSWDLTTITGQVYASRYNNITWTTVSCAPQSLIISESSYFSMSNANPDRINATFNWSTHKPFQVGQNSIGANSCNSTVTYINSTRQAPTASSPFQELLMQDANNYMVYLTDISYKTQGYDNTTYDFQMIVPENVSGSPTSYYFYIELR
jgi:hypothetical protein